MMNKGPMKKLQHEPVTAAHLKERARRITLAGYQKSKWIIFCEELLSEGFKLELYEALKTNSKYITVLGVLPDGITGKPFKVRFSDHRPIFHKEAAGDCDFFVGVTNLTVTNYKDAIAAVHRHFNHTWHED